MTTNANRTPGLIRTALLATLLASAPLAAAHAGNVYDSHIMQRMKFTPQQSARVRAELRISDRQTRAIFRKYHINPYAKPDLDKLQEASDELQAVSDREKQHMRSILTMAQYDTYLKIKKETEKRIIRAARE